MREDLSVSLRSLFVLVVVFAIYGYSQMPSFENDSYVVMAWHWSPPIGLFGILLAVIGAVVSAVALKGWKKIVYPIIFVVLGIGEAVSIYRADDQHKNEVKALQDSIQSLKDKIDHIATTVPPSERQGAAQQLKRQIDNPYLRMELGQSMNPKWAFETRFILTNPNLLSVTGATYYCIIPHVEAGGMLSLNQPTNVTNLVFSLLEDLPPGRQRSLLCNFSASEGLVSRVDPLIVNIWVAYLYDNKPRADGFKFFAKHKEDGTYAWFPGGAADPWPIPLPKPR